MMGYDHRNFNQLSPEDYNTNATAMYGEYPKYMNILWMSQNINIVTAIGANQRDVFGIPQKLGGGGITKPFLSYFLISISSINLKHRIIVYKLKTRNVRIIHFTYSLKSIIT